jgi:CRP-like cAMP-binding protein
MTQTWLDFSLLTRAGFPLRRYAAGEKIFVQDDEGSSMYVVRSGRVSIMTYGTVLESVGANGMFGEMALIDGSPRSATAVAASPPKWPQSIEKPSPTWSGRTRISRCASCGCWRRAFAR